MAVFRGGEVVDHYQYLGIGRSASPNQIESAARLALLRHGADAELTERIMDAWYIVGDPDRRFDYDFWLLTHPSPVGTTPQRNTGLHRNGFPNPICRGCPGHEMHRGSCRPSEAASPRRSNFPLPPRQRGRRRSWTLRSRPAEAAQVPG